MNKKDTTHLLHLLFALEQPKAILFALFLLLPVQLHAIQTKIDLELYQLEKANKQQLPDIANRLFDILYKEHFMEDHPHFTAEVHPDSIRAITWYWAAEYMYDLQDHDRCIALIERTLPLLHKNQNKRLKSDACNIAGLAWFRKSNYYKAITYIKKSHDIDMQLGDKDRINSSLSNMAGIFLAAQQADMAEKCILKSINICRLLNNPDQLATRYGMASEIYHSMKKEQQALSYATKAFQLDSIGQLPKKIAIRRSQRAAALIAMGDMKAAKDELDKAMPILKNANNSISWGICCNQMGEILTASRQQGKAIGYFRQAADIFASKHDRYNESRARLGLYKALRNTDPEEAMKQLIIYSELKDSLYNNDMKNAIGYYIADLNQEELEQKATSLRYTNLMTVIIAITVFIIMIGVIVVLQLATRMKSKSNAALHDLTLARDQFFTNIAHEFRTPLAVIQAACHDILNAKPEEISQIYQDTTNIQRQGFNLLQLINRILALSKLKSDRSFKPQWYRGNIVHLAKITIDSFRNLANQKQIKLQCALSTPHIEIDFVPEYLQNILHNVVANAIKFSPDGTDVKIQIGADDRQVKILVSDAGIGISEEDMQHIFEPFYQAPGNDKKHVGSGIGLPLVKLSAEAMNGQVSVRSTPGHGSEFLISLPLKHEHTIWPLYTEFENEPIAEAFTPSNSFDLTDDAMENEDAIRILIAEDTPEVAHYMARQLKGSYSFYFAPNGRVALEKANTLIPDVIITDIMMPEINGFELCRQIRASELLNHIPVIIVTAKATHEDRMTGLEAGADVYLEKPFYHDELNIRVTKLLEQRQLLREKFSQKMTEPQAVKLTIDDAQEPKNELISKFIKSVHKQLPTGKVDYNVIASELFITRTQLNRKIKSISGMTTSDYIHAIRIAVAKELLRNHDLPINEIAIKCGMNDVSYFCALFKKATGMTPGQFRIQNM